RIGSKRAMSGRRWPAANAAPICVSAGFRVPPERLRQQFTALIRLSVALRPCPVLAHYKGIDNSAWRAGMQVSKIFVVIDPTTPTQIALARAADIARGTKIDIHAYICIDENYSGVDDSTAMREAELARHEAWLSGLIRPHVDSGLSITSEVECKDDWRAALAPAAVRAKADLIIKESRRRTPLQRRFLQTSDWMLLRNAECPVLLVKSLRQGPLTHVLAAINLNAKDEAHQALTDTVIDYSRALAEATGAELHAVNA